MRSSRLWSTAALPTWTDFLPLCQRRSELSSTLSSLPRCSLVAHNTLLSQIDARRDNVVSAVASGNFESLLEHDQLLKNLATNQAFRLRSFKEPHITFPPTYKYVVRSRRL